MSHCIVIIDDEEVLTRVMTRVLVRHGYEVKVSNSCAEAWRALSECHPIHHVLVDITLRDGDGLALAQAIHVKYPDVPVTLMTGNVAPLSCQLPLLLKPYSTEDLYAAVA
ncbi:MAG: response regulator [Gemmatimonadota bacterium]